MSLPIPAYEREQSGTETEQSNGVALSEAGSVAVAALLHLVRLMGADLVLARPDCDAGPFEKAVRAKLGQFNSPTNNKQAIDAGVAFAQSLVEQVLTQIRAQAETKKNLKTASHRHAGPDSANAERLPTRLLN